MRLDGSVLRSHTEVKSQRHASTRLTLLDTFLQYRGVHYKDGAIIIFFYVFYRVTDLGGCYRPPDADGALLRHLLAYRADDFFTVSDLVPWAG